MSVEGLGSRVECQVQVIHVVFGADDVRVLEDDGLGDDALSWKDNMVIILIIYSTSDEPVRIYLLMYSYNH